MSCEGALNLTNEKNFPRIISQWEFDYGLFTNLPKIIVACDFSLSSFGDFEEDGCQSNFVCYVKTIIVFL